MKKYMKHIFRALVVTGLTFYWALNLHADPGGGDMVTADLDTDGGRFTLKLNGRMTSYPKDTTMAGVPATGQLMLRGNKLVSAGQVQKVTSERVLLVFSEKTEDFLITNTTKVCTKTGLAQNITIEVGDSVTIVSDPDAVNAATIYLGEFFILMNRENPNQMDVRIEDYTCGDSSSSRKD